MTDIELGATYKDAVSGYEGVATSKTSFLFACERVCLSQGHKEDDGKEKYATFDAAQLIKVKGPSKEVKAALAAMGLDEDASTEEPKAKKTKAKPRTGGDRPMPSMERP